MALKIDEFTILDKYQAWVETKARKHQTKKESKCVAALGLVGEAGEYADLIKKEQFHDKPIEIMKKILELGDILFYVSLAASEEGISLRDIMQENMKKLNARYPTGFDPKRAHAPGEKPAEGRSTEWPQSAGE